MTRRGWILLCVALFAADPFAPVRATEALAFKVRQHWVGLKSRRIEPTAGVDAALAFRMRSAPFDRLHVIVQFEAPLTEETARRRLSRFEAVVLDYLPLDSWIVEADARVIDAFGAGIGVRWIGALEPRDRIDPQLVRGGPPAHAVEADGWVRCLVHLFPDPDPARGEVVLSSHGQILARSGLGRAWQVLAPPTGLEALSREEAVQWIEAVPPPPQPKLDGQRVNMKVDDVQAAPFSLDGAGIIGGIWEVNTPDTASARGRRSASGTTTTTWAVPVRSVSRSPRPLRPRSTTTRRS